MNKLIYYSNFNDVANTPVRVEIYKETQEEVTAKELILSSEPIVIDYTSEELFQPLKQSACTINVLTSEVLLDLYTGSTNEISVKVIKDDDLFWYGFLTPNIYSSEYNSDFDLLSLEFIDCIAQLENVKYNGIGGNVMSLRGLISTALGVIDYDENENRVIKNIIHPNNLNTSFNSNDLFGKLVFQTRNLSDESGDFQTYNWALSEAMRFLGYTLMQYGDSLLVLDYEALKLQDELPYLRYSLESGAIYEYNLGNGVFDLYSLGVAQTNGSISLGNVYNQVNLVANTNPIGDLVPDLFDDLTNQNADPNKYYQKEVEGEQHIAAYFDSAEWDNHGLYKIQGSWTSPMYDFTLDDVYNGKGENLGYTSQPDSGTGKGTDGAHIGGFFQRADNWKNEDGVPSTLRWKDYFTFVKTYPEASTYEPVRLTAKSVTALKGGSLVLSLDYMLSQSPIATDTMAGLNTLKFSEIIDNENSQRFQIKDVVKFKVRLQIGGWYYNGGEWVNSEQYFYITRKNNSDDKVFNTVYSIDNQVKFTDSLIDSGEGVLINLPNDKLLMGEVVFDLYPIEGLGEKFVIYRDTPVYQFLIKYVHIEGLKLTYVNKSHYIDIFNQEKHDEDILYSSVIDEKYITEMDDITLQFNTYSPNIGSYSYMLERSTGTNYDFLGTVTNSITGKEGKMEELILEKYVNYYSEPKMVYSNTLNYKYQFQPYNTLREPLLKRNFIPDSFSFDLKNNTVTINAKEI